MNQKNKNEIIIKHNQLLLDTSVMFAHLTHCSSVEKENFLQLKSMIEKMNHSFSQLQDCIELNKFSGWKIFKDWQCPVCKTPNIETVSADGTITCIQGHHSR